ncbi:MAG TPA: protein kinase [Dermatophilaceae bacterium]
MPGFDTTGELSLSATGSEWAAVRSVDGRRFVLKVVPVEDITAAQALAAEQLADYGRVESRHLVRRHAAIAIADGSLALVLDEVTGGSLAQLLGARGQLTVGETVTTVAPLLRALADLHAAGLVHGNLVPGNIRFSADGRPLIGDLGVGRLLGGQAGPLDRAGAGGFAAPELVGGAVPSAASDVYAMAALGWFCLTGSPPAPAATRPLPAVSRPETPAALAEVLTACLATDPAARPTADEAAVEVFDAAPAESVALASVSDPAAEITRRIRAAAVSVADPRAPGIGKRYRTALAIGVVALLLAGAVGAGTTWFLRRPQVVSQPVRPAARSSLLPARTPATAATTRLGTMPTPTATPARTPAAIAPTRVSRSSNEVVMASSSPRTAASGLLQALVDARALAYVARNSALLDLVYAPGAARAQVDRGNIATALRNGGTYLGLSYSIKDAAFLDGTSGTARIRATILTPAYNTGQPDGRRILHARETLGPCIFALSLTPDGWRILGLTVPGPP